jgi:hypothetical protein
LQRVHRKRNQVYEDKDFQIQSLNSLVKAAKQKHCDNFERVDTEAQDVPPVVLPIHHFTESLTDSLQEMHHHLQSLLMQKLGPDARNVIAAERARLNHDERNKLEKTRSKREQNQRESDYIATHLSEVGQNDKDELELLNEYRERYAEILAELLVARDRLIELDKTMQRTAGAKLARRLSEDLSEISDDEVAERRKRMEERRRRRSSVRSDSVSEDDGDDASKRRKWLARRRRSSSIQERSEETSIPKMDDWGKWN